MDIIEKLAGEFKVRKGQVENTVNLIDEGNTIPFIARYRKEATGGLSDVVLRDMSGLPEDSLLYEKLTDLHLIFDEYEKKIEGRYTDSEDYIDLYMDRIGRSKLIKGAAVWVYGFDSFAPKAMGVLARIMSAVGSKRATTLPSLSAMNLVKFHLMFGLFL